MTDADPVTCRDCGTEIDGYATFVVRGTFDPSRQGFKSGGHNWHLCRQCWSRDYDSKKATTYQTEDADELWAILAASGGQLVANLSAFFIPGPCYARVVDDELEVATVNRAPAPADADGDFEYESELIDEHDLFLEDVIEKNERDIPIYLETADTTPFGDIREDVEIRDRDELLSGGDA